MEIYIAKNKTQMGPYDIGQVTQMIQSAILEKYDLYWHEGMLDWAPVASLGEQRKEPNFENNTSSQPYKPTIEPTGHGKDSSKEDADKVILAARICLGLSLLMPLILGVIGLLFSGPFALVSFILGIVILVKGRTLEGVAAIILSILCPMLGWGMWAASMAFYTGLIHKGP
jgi:hypothetical protein